MREVKEVLRVNAFDDANAELIGALPVHERPVDWTSASEWICSEYRRKGQMAELAFAQRDGKRCGDGALDVLKCLEDTKAGKPSSSCWNTPTGQVRNLTPVHLRAQCTWHIPAAGQPS